MPELVIYSADETVLELGVTYPTCEYFDMAEW